MKITIGTGNSAFGEGNMEMEIVRILRNLADKIESGNRPKSVNDINGNKVCFIDY